MEMMINVRHGKTRMMRLLGFLLAVAFMMGAAFAESAAPAAGDSILAQLDGINWSFCSGAGGWSTDMQIAPDGSFSGDYHDSEIGEYADAYPDGTIYYCSFTGKLSLVEQVNENTWKLRVDELKLEEKPGTETLADNVRYVTSEIYGLSEGDEMLLYRPGTPVSALSEEMQFWAHVVNLENPPEELEDWFLSSEANNSGFVGFPAVSYANPWEEMTAEQLEEVSGLSFGVPDGAENVTYRYMQSDGLAEMQFTMGSDEFCARIQPAELEEGQIMNISGMYFDWDNEQDIKVGQCSGTLGQAQTGSEDWVELCLWYDAEKKLQYSLSVYTTELDGLDLIWFAEQICPPEQ